jgi:hypothetical protein
MGSQASKPAAAPTSVTTFDEKRSYSYQAPVTQFSSLSIDDAADGSTSLTASALDKWASDFDAVSPSAAESYMLTLVEPYLAIIPIDIVQGRSNCFPDFA